jgi:hypothetical protein
MNPAGAEHALTPGPEALPTSLVHAMGETESEAFKGGKDGEFFSRRFNHRDAIADTAVDDHEIRVTE